ncbi:hypothetical protein BAUCODRAFT_30245 [Baudoinia panamericana UAMH 10762]|uniref:GIT Spa2 homology (SHD) domain-containing protein n=1 Tax=Baudoinia panamericana (strain UAMH 10762) TaxID=717646 RepID=M2MSH9_BAUPA|nr:uncharacterized protein BAUCODRAFT_30245 [Baudoinia panamericana UAMH 10762]EMC99831.1 hypothetical protein BAUCODRAFT_30245 [Baudoinia panamericana UAMH 10762]
MSRPGFAPSASMSMSSNDSFGPRYGGPLGGTLADSPYSGGPYGAAQPRHASPSGSQHPSSGTDMSRPSASGSSIGRPASSASSVGRSSDGRMGFATGPPPNRDSTRSFFKPEAEAQLQQHYYVLRDYLAASLRDDQGNMRSQKARDKLLRLSVTQFMELSTDVYDELLRREDERGARQSSIPRSLPPKTNFHPKRNQARQKLSTLPVDRFRQLATDVYYELERRIPRFAGQDIERPASTASHGSGRAPSRNGMRPPPGAYRGPPPGAGRNGSIGGPMPGPQYPSFRPASPGPGMPPPGYRPSTSGSDTSNYGRPLPKTFQSNVIVPNKSTMVEDDQMTEPGEEDAFALDKVLSPSIGPSPISNDRSPLAGDRYFEEPKSMSADLDKIKEQEAEIGKLRETVEDLQSRVLDKQHEYDSLRETLSAKDEEFEGAKTTILEREAGIESERNGWHRLREELEQKHIDAQRLHDELSRELEQLKLNKQQDEQDSRSRHERELEGLRSQLGSSHRQTIGDLRVQLGNVAQQTSDLHRQLQTHQAENEELRNQLHSAHQRQQSLTSNGEHERRIEALQEELTAQQKLTNQVRDEAMMYLQEMRDLSRQTDYAVEQEERLAQRVAQLERENEEWRHRYTRVKAQNKSLRASTMGLALPNAFDANSLLGGGKEGLISDAGLVRDVDMTRFQLSIDELLRTARQPEQNERMLDGVKNVALAVQGLTAAVVSPQGYPTPSPSPLGPERDGGAESVAKVKARVNGTANSLITATKLHASAMGLSPVALVDAAASNLTAAVVELVKTVGIRPSEGHELNSEIGEDDTEVTIDGPGDHHHHHQQHLRDESMGSFYNDSPSYSPARGLPGRGSEVHSPSPSGSVNGVVTPSLEISSETPPPSKPAPLNLGRSNTGRKNGWFGGWGRKASEDETATLAQTHTQSQATESGKAVTHGQGHADGVAEGLASEEYDPYR